MLTQRFKQQFINVTTSLLKKTYIMKNVRRNWESRKYVQKIIRLTKSIEMNSMFNQLNIIYNKIETTLRRNVKRSSNTITMNEFLQELNECKKIWWFLIKDWRNQNTIREYENWNYDKRNQYSNQNFSYQSKLEREYLSYYQQTLWNRYLKASWRV